MCSSLIDALSAVMRVRSPEVTTARARFRCYFESRGICLVDPRQREADGDVLVIQTYHHLFLSLYLARIAELFTDRIDSSPLERLVDGSWDGLGSILTAQSFRDVGFENLLVPELYQWVAEVQDEELRRAVRELGAELLELPLEPTEGGDSDPLRELYLSLSPRSTRRGLGEFYTPDWLVELVLERVGWPGARAERLLDPTCGSGSFLCQAIRQLRARSPNLEPAVLAREVLRRVQGIDLNPVAVSTARVNYLIALGGELVCALGGVRLPVWLGDALLGPGEASASGPACWPAAPVELLVGNPPWINWERLTPAYRDAIIAHPRHYAQALFPHRGLAARGGGAHDDVAALITVACADAFLGDGGRMGLVLPLSLFKSKGGGAGFRSFALPSASLKVEQVDDLARLRPFPGASGRAAVLTAIRGLPTVYPVRYQRWSAGTKLAATESLCRARRVCSLNPEHAVPVDSSDATSPWLTAPPDELEALRSVAGESGYRARKGVDTSLNAVFWVRVLDRRGSAVRVINAQTRSRAAVEPQEALVESEVVYPLLRGRDFRRWTHSVAYHLLLLYDPERGRPRQVEEAEARCPRALAYFHGYPELLGGRRIYAKHLQRQPLYACYDIGPYTFAPFKVVWKALASGIQAAVVGCDQGRVVVPDHNVVLVPFDDPDEAHYLCAVLNSRASTAFATAYTAWFFSAHLLRYLRIPKYNARSSCHQELSRLSRDAHRAEVRDHRALERSIDEQVGRLQGFESFRRLAGGGDRPGSQKPR